MAKKVIAIRELTYTYPDGIKALDNINLDVFEGESVGIIGPNGAGKSTLLLHLNGILKGNSYIRILDLDIKNENLSQVRNKVGMVFQNPENQLFMPTVFDDVSFGPINMKLPKTEVERCVSEALKEVDMLDSIKRFPHHLSFGEKKRISIATVLSMKPEILALDEPTSNLGPKARFELIELLKNINKTKIIASHDLEMILEVCSRSVILGKGRIIKIGPTREILSNFSLLEKHSLIPSASLKYSLTQ